MPSDAGAGSRHGSGQVGGPRLGVPRSERSRALGVRGERWKEFIVLVLLGAICEQRHTEVPRGEYIHFCSRDMLTS